MKNYSLVIYNNLTLALKKTFEKRTHSIPKGFSSLVTPKNDISVT